MRTLVFGLVLALPLAAQAGAPKAPLDRLFDQLRSAQTGEEAKGLESQILAQFLASGSPSADLLMTRALAAQAAGNKDLARKLVDAVTEIAPAFAEGWHRRGMLQAEAGDDAQAMVSLQKAIQLNPRHFEALEQLGEMLEEYGDKPGALKVYRRALAIDPNYEGLQHHIDGLSRTVEGQGI